jgi:hypothetical protein
MKCGSEIPENGSFCPKCGTRLISETENERQIQETNAKTIPTGIVVASLFLSILSVLCSISLFSGRYGHSRVTLPYVYITCAISLLLVIGCVLLKRIPAFVAVLGGIVAVADFLTILNFVGMAGSFRGSFLFGLNIMRFIAPVAYIIFAVGVFAKGGAGRIFYLIAMLLFVILSVLLSFETIRVVGEPVFLGLASPRIPIYIR